LIEGFTLNQIINRYKDIREIDTVYLHGTKNHEIPAIVDSGDTLWLTEDAETYEPIATLEHSYDDYGNKIDPTTYSLSNYFECTNGLPLTCSKYINADSLDDAYRKWFEWALNFYHPPGEPIEMHGKIEHEATYNCYDVSMTITPLHQLTKKPPTKKKKMKRKKV